MKLLWRALVVLVIFAGVGLVVNKLVVTHTQTANTPPSQVRLSAAMAGLFTGGAAASIAVLILAFGRRR